MPSRSTHGMPINPAKQQLSTLRSSHHDLLNRLQNATFLVERLQTRETIALAERDHARADTQRILEDLDAAVRRVKQAKSTPLKLRALIFLLAVVAVLIAMQWANRTLYQPEFELVAKMTRNGLGLE